MHHLAILKKSLKLLEKIVAGEKTIESRWSVNAIAPYRMVSIGDTLFFKDSGEPVTAKASIEKVEYHDTLTDEIIRSLLKKHGSQIGVDESYADELKGRKYATLVFLKDVAKIEPFEVKRMYGTAWVCVEDIESLKK